MSTLNSSGLLNGILGNNALVGGLLNSLLGSNGHGNGLLGGNSLLSGILGSQDTQGQGVISNLGLESVVNPYAQNMSSGNSTLLGDLTGTSGLNLLGNGGLLGGNLLSPNGLLGGLLSTL